MNRTPPLPPATRATAGLLLEGPPPDTDTERRFAWSVTLTRELLLPEMERTRAVRSVRHLEVSEEPLARELDRRLHIDLIVNDYPVTVKNSWTAIHDTFAVPERQWSAIKANFHAKKLGPLAIVAAQYDLQDRGDYSEAWLHSWRLAEIESLIANEHLATEKSARDAVLVVWRWDELEDAGVVLEPRPGRLAA